MPDHAEINLLLQSAYDHHRASRYAEAIRDYQAALRLDPHNFNAHHDLLLAYHDTGQLILAFEELQAAVRLSPDSDSIANLKSILFDALGGISNSPPLQEIISQLPEDASDCPTLLGLRASQQKDYPQALIHFETALREHPDTAYLQGYAGRVLLSLRRYSDARKALTAATRDESAKSQDLYNLAVAKSNLGEYASAIHALERAVQTDKNYHKAWALLATTHGRLGHGRSAWRCFRQAVRIHPEMRASRLSISAAF